MIIPTNEGIKRASTRGSRNTKHMDFVRWSLCSRKIVLKKGRSLLSKCFIICVILSYFVNIINLAESFVLFYIYFICLSILPAYINNITLRRWYWFPGTGARDSYVPLCG